MVSARHEQSGFYGGERASCMRAQSVQHEPGGEVRCQATSVTSWTLVTFPNNYKRKPKPSEMKLHWKK